MPYCRNCGVRLPEDAVFCPSCGSSVEVKAQSKLEPKEFAFRYLVVGLMGAFLSVLISSFSSVDLFFVPSFVSSIFIIYIYRINDVKGSLLVTFMIYVFTDGILGTIVLGQSYILNMRLVYTPNILDVVLYSLNPISAFLAAYIGVTISPKRREPASAPYPRREEEGSGGVIYSL